MEIHLLGSGGAAAKAIIDDVQARLTDRVFIASGDGSDSPYHQWRCAFHLGRTPDRSAYGLILLDYGDLDDDDYDGEDAYVETVAVATDVAGWQESEIVQALLKAYRDAGGKYIDTFDEVGDFDLGEHWEGDDDEEDEDGEGVVTCPFCGRMNYGAGETCEHVLGAGEARLTEFADSSWDLNDVLSDLESAASDVLSLDPERVPGDVRDQAKKLCENVNLWEEDPEIDASAWMSEGGMLSGMWTVYFHADPPGLIRRTREDAERWLERFQQVVDEARHGDIE
jgi:hypothetical protein